MEIETKEQNLLEVKIVKNDEQSQYICKICSYPFNQPVQCEICENIYCYNCIIEYVFVNKKCPSQCSVIHLIKISRILLNTIQKSVLIQCNFCEIQINPFEFKQHLTSTHSYQFQEPDFKKQLSIPPLQKMTEIQKYQYLLEVDSLINIEEKGNEEIMFTMKCSICLKYLNEESSQCFSCENVWCTQCVRRFEKNKKDYCFNRCAPQNFIHIQKDFKEKYFNKYKVKCEECGGWFKVEDHTYHLKQYHSQQINQDPTLAVYYLKYGRYYQKDGQYEKANQYFAQGLSYDYSNTSLWFNRALSLSKIKKCKESIIYYREYLKIIEDPSIYYNIGINLKRLDYTQEAIETYKKAISIDASYYKAYNNLGCCLHDLGQLDEALEIFDQGIKINDSYCNVYDSKATVLFQKGQINEAFQLYQKAIDIDSNYYYPYLGRARCYFELGNYEQALLDVMIFIENEDKDLDLANNLVQKIKQKQLEIVSQKNNIDQ
ncbi:tetratricopeptide repeat protein (macronuclear) [Tetrahymena thermophila SB210]|uniref:Tetratricopeptide repeat protein n=1 Tax=Tetrahymena thermophila (strain SB210) TaxID=312017 RepID=I7LUF9_TETTS|nr:tetratricopeptide repeat protein [Tetrahymena thermophila SB210]EAR92971.1 tetratricopeptide repeat protein [Tetrahymena thermophila SB210]|eukprot:XP_001013216.1 tetratricopeptide repeat protein [Tetrahymena thermophila SB210]